MVFIMLLTFIFKADVRVRELFISFKRIVFYEFLHHMVVPIGDKKGA